MTTELIMFLVTFLSQNLYRLDENAEKEKKKKRIQVKKYSLHIWTHLCIAVGGYKRLCNYRKSRLRCCYYLNACLIIFILFYFLNNSLETDLFVFLSCDGYAKCLSL